MADERHRPPRWAKEEIVLALDLYLTAGHWLDENDPRVIELSDLLRSLDIHPDKGDAALFRNPNGVSMKLANFESLNPTYTENGRVGLPGASKLDREVWAEYSDDLNALHAVAMGLRSTAGKRVPPAGLEDTEAESYPEGSYAYRVHRSRERSSAAVNKKRANAKAANNYKCEACGLTPDEVYGALGATVLECHHLVPISQYRIGQRTKLEDLALLCANCHRAIHVSATPLSVVELAGRLGK